MYIMNKNLHDRFHTHVIKKMTTYMFREIFANMHESLCRFILNFFY